MSDIQTRPITKLAELDEALAALCGFTPETIEGNDYPESRTVWSYTTTFHPTTNAADNERLREWVETTGLDWECEKLSGAPYEIDLCGSVNSDRRYGHCINRDFKVAVSVAIARACGFTVELEDV